MAELEIYLVHNHPREEVSRDQLLRLHELYDLNRWRFTQSVAIDHLAIPHSQPILTLNTRWWRDDLPALSTYLHEQLHWFSLMGMGDFAQAGRELRTRYPDVPVYEAGARDERSTYLHLVICALELQSLIEVLGSKEPAFDTLCLFANYRWIYDTILSDWEYFKDLLPRTGIIVPA